ncbi:hypothetical protein SAMN02745157_1535 [Kaistia soli DSM 19436]|uniref:DUF6950 domain-containing protein n=1 Tax=Kaistia soli DSM 19436 TaxID=1122133 RepID=A0A1M4YJC4_9HYPH|nr:hypothetical protein [Kaistia soli]SHF05748.1 hypothetical protein SAMN02745157_1535 [Kaistia soli DSM 19436]
MLVTFLADLARRPFRWGECDCSLIIADWWRVNHGVDPAAHLRGTYADEPACEALLAREGGRRALVTRLATSVGALPTDTPSPGDFGVVSGGVVTEMPAIMTPDGKWAVKSRRGLIVFAPAEINASWRI